MNIMFSFLIIAIFVILFGGIGGILLQAGFKNWKNMTQQETGITTPFQVAVALTEIGSGLLLMILAMILIITFVGRI